MCKKNYYISLKDKNYFYLEIVPFYLLKLNFKTRAYTKAYKTYLFFLN